MLRRFRPSWRSALSLACGLAVLLVLIELDLGTGLAIVLALFTAAFVFSLIARRDVAPSPRRAAARPKARPATVRAGHEVIAVRDIGGGAFGGDFIPQGTRGVVTGTSWGNVDVTFDVAGVFGGHQSRVRVSAEQLRRI